MIPSYVKGLLRTRQARPRALSMLPLTRSASQEEVGYEKVCLLICTFTLLIVSVLL
ncbi:unnamed protein product [Heligmosomoides polygyrus]|uniref:Uncharacterized protein n=1 Tax=Heligmosomoides polygyrus TaxID=6339 RepID=A0A183F248_HELPZ|nr:unnamed protein product [Heligmosomoides polygyrus]